MNTYKLNYFDMARKYSTPFYCYEACQIDNTINLLLKYFPPTVTIHYSMKANPNLAVCEHIRKGGLSVEVCSLGELNTAMKAGFKSKDIIAVGPAKKEDFLSKLIAHNVFLIICESKRELEIIDKLAKITKKTVNVLLRINPRFSVKTAALKMGGVASQFGIDEEQVFQCPELFKSSPHVNCLGFQVFNASGVIDEDDIVKNIERIIRLSLALAEVMNINLKVIDVGGGLSVSADLKDRIQVHSLAGKIKVVLSHLSLSSDIKILMEMGRYLLSRSGVFVCEVIDIKTSRGKNYIITDGGINNLLGGFGLSKHLSKQAEIQLIKNKPHKKSEKRYYDVVGPLCTPQDVHARACLLDCANIGDLILIPQVGAYGFTASPQLFLSHPPPSEILRFDGEMDCTRNNSDKSMECVV